MSGIFGIFNHTGSPVERGDLQAMHDVFTQWFDDDRGIWCEGKVGLGHTMLWNTPESKLENLPDLADAECRPLIITADVRLDNRSELADVLGIDQPLASITDSQLLLAAYKKWGEGSPKHLLGDFSYVIWDEAKKRLFCARDHVGMKPLYYHQGPRRFIFANHVHAVTAVDGVSKTISEEAVCLYLKEGELYSPELTFYEAVKKLPPASTLVVDAGAVHIKQYWRLEDSPRIQLQSAEEYSERLRHLLEQSVACRLRSAYPISAHLSGGLDSSAIAVLAARELQKNGQTLETFNWCSGPVEGETTASPEWSMGVALAKQMGMGHHFVTLTARKLAALLAEHDVTMNDTTDLWYELDVRRAVSSSGGRTLLSGWGGDHLISNHGDYVVAELFWSGRLFTAISYLYKASREARKPLRRFFGMLYREVVEPVLPVFMSARTRDMHESVGDFAQCAKPNIAAVVRVRTPVSPWHRCFSVRADQLQQYNAGHLHNRLDSWASAGQQQKIEYRYPLLDKRLIEFAVGIPGEYFQRDGLGRYVFRAALADVLPHDICWCAPKAEPERVAQLLAIEKQALALWLARQKMLAPAREFASLFTDYSKIERLIDHLLDNKKRSLEEDFGLIDTLIKSILLQRL